jgi:hypothetical protein
MTESLSWPRPVWIPQAQASFVLPGNSANFAILYEGTAAISEFQQFKHRGNVGIGDSGKFADAGAAPDNAKSWA